MIKYASNNYHALKVAFANEIGALCQQLGADGHAVMRVFCEDRDLNISPGTCAPASASADRACPRTCAPSTRREGARRGGAAARERARAATTRTSSASWTRCSRSGKPRVALLGLSFKSGSDDLRESPFVRLAESLIGKGVPLRIFDPDVDLGSVFGRNRAYIEEHLPHVAQLVADLEEATARAEVVIVGKRVADVETLRGVAGDGRSSW
jgi:GDP-mannose 6-dehydrogenase